MFYRDFTEEQLHGVISCIIGGEKFKAISLYRELDKESSSENVISRVIEIASKISEWMNDKNFAMRHIPSVCCLNCTGRGCGAWKRKVANGGFDPVSCKFEGCACTAFDSAEEFINTNNENQITFVVGKDEVNYLRREIKLKIEKKICSVSFDIYNYRQKRLIKSKKRIFLIDSSVPLTHAIKKLRRSIVMSSNNIVPDTLTIDDREPTKKDKTYKDYFERCQKEIRKRNATATKRIYSLPYEEACTEFLNICSPSEKGIIASMGGDIKTYLRTFYNGQSVWQVLENIETA